MSSPRPRMRDGGIVAAADSLDEAVNHLNPLLDANPRSGVRALDPCRLQPTPLRVASPYLAPLNLLPPVEGHGVVRLGA